jgi:hypothetical protein
MQLGKLKYVALEIGFILVKCRCSHVHFQQCIRGATISTSVDERAKTPAATLTPRNLVG